MGGRHRKGGDSVLEGKEGEKRCWQENKGGRRAQKKGEASASSKRKRRSSILPAGRGEREDLIRMDSKGERKGKGFFS